MPVDGGVGGLVRGGQEVKLLIRRHTVIIVMMVRAQQVHDLILIVLSSEQ